MQKANVLSIDLSKKSPQEIAQFLSALLGAKKILLQYHGLNIRLLPKTRKVRLNKSTPEE